MKRFPGAAFVAVLALSGMGSLAGPDPAGIRTLADLEAWIQRYYEQPQPELTVAALKVLERERLLEQSPAQAALAGFLSEVFRAQPERLAEWGPQLDRLTVKTKRIVWLSLWISGTPAALAWLRERAATAEGEDRKYLAVLLRQSPLVLYTKRIVTPVDVDLLWGAFLASGNAEYVKRIIALLPWCHDLRDMHRRLVGESARWLLTNQTARHPRVRQICMDECNRAQAPLKTMLAGVLKAADELAEEAGGH